MAHWWAACRSDNFDEIVGVVGVVQCEGNSRGKREHRVIVASHLQGNGLGTCISDAIAEVVYTRMHLDTKHGGT